MAPVAASPFVRVLLYESALWASGRTSSSEQFDLGPAQGLDFRQIGMFLPRTIEVLHEYSRARVGNRPQTRDDRFRALPLREHTEALHFFSIRAAVAHRRVARRQRQYVNAADEVVARA